MRRFSKSPLLLVFLCLLFTLPISCKKVKDPAFTGDWVFEEQVRSGEITYNTSRTINMTATSFSEAYTIQRQGSGYYTSITGLKGDLVINHSNLVFSLEELGTCVKDELDFCTGEVVWYSQGTPYWNDNIQFFQHDVYGEFEADATTLHLWRDLNDDGDFEDNGEDIIFEKIVNP